MQYVYGALIASGTILALWVWAMMRASAMTDRIARATQREPIGYLCAEKIKVGDWIVTSRDGMGEVTHVTRLSRRRFDISLDNGITLHVTRDTLIEVLPDPLDGGRVRG